MKTQELEWLATGFLLLEQHGPVQRAKHTVLLWLHCSKPKGSCTSNGVSEVGAQDNLRCAKLLNPYGHRAHAHTHTTQLCQLRLWRKQPLQGRSVTGQQANHTIRPPLPHPTRNEHHHYHTHTHTHTHTHAWFSDTPPHRGRAVQCNVWLRTYVRTYVATGT